MQRPTKGYLPRPTYSIVALLRHKNGNLINMYIRFAQDKGMQQPDEARGMHTSAHRPAQTPLDTTSKHEHKHIQFLRCCTVDSLYPHQKKVCCSSLDTQHTLAGESQQTLQQQRTSLSRSKSCNSTQKDSKSDLCVHTLAGESQQTLQQQRTSLSRSKSCSSTQKNSKSDMCVLRDIAVGRHSYHKKSVDYVIPVFKHTTSPARLPSGMADTKQAAPSFPSRLRLFFQSMCTRWVRS